MTLPHFKRFHCSNPLYLSWLFFLIKSGRHDVAEKMLSHDKRPTPQNPTMNYV